MEESIKKEVRFNKYPFFLWTTYKKMVKLYDNNTKVQSDENNSELVKIHKVKISLLKYFPLILLLGFSSPYPESLLEFFYIIVALFINGIAITLYFFNINYLVNYLKLLLVASLGVGYYDLFYNDMNFVVYIDLSWVYILWCLLLFFILVDFKNNLKYEFYELRDIKKESTYTIKTERKERPFLNLVLWKPKLFRFNSGFNSSFSFKFIFGGYYMRVSKND